MLSAFSAVGTTAANKVSGALRFSAPQSGKSEEIINMLETLTSPITTTLEHEAKIVSIPLRAEGAAASPFRNVRRILLPFDLSRASVSALRIVMNLAEALGATIHLLHVVPPSRSVVTDGTAPNSNRADDYLAEASERLLKHWLKRIVQQRVKSYVSLRIGDPADVIVARAIAMRADLIVLTSRSSSGSTLEFQRSTAERVSRIAPCPVLTILEKCTERLAYSETPFASDWRTILVPVDFSSVAEEAVRKAARFASATGGQILLAHGCDLEEAEEPLVNERLHDWATRIVGHTVPWATAIWPGGHSLYAILSEAMRTEANLIVLPTATQPWARRLRAGSITDGVLRHAPCPVLGINNKVNSRDN
jgi:nucleotide-binding universal stress UspA family protein